MTTTEHFGDALCETVRRKNTRLVVGLDPHLHLMPESLKAECAGEDYGALLRAFFIPVVDRCLPFVAGFKPQIAFFEQFGVPGLAALVDILSHIHSQGGIVIMDGKRNDIGSTAKAYANAFFGGKNLPAAFPSDALTVNAYLGEDGLEPFLENPAKGIFALVKTSNPSSGRIQDLRVTDGGTVAEATADLVTEFASRSAGASGYGNAGAVIGATYPEHMRALRKRLPHSWLLVPGYGAQGGDDEAVAAAMHPGGLGALINSSRGVLFPKDFGERGFDAVADAAERSRDHINSLVP